MALEQFSVSWDNFHKNMSSGMNSLLQNENFVDVTLAVEGRYLKAHKMVLSVCSSYFGELFKTSPCKHPIVFMKDVSYVVMSDLLQFMYQGEVRVNEENFTNFLKTAESLQIKGLSNYDNIPPDYGTKSQTTGKKSMETKVQMSQNAPPKVPPPRSDAPAPKRPRLNYETISNENEIVKTEANVMATPATSEESIYLKSEPYDHEGAIDDNSNENFMLDDPLDETNDTNEDYWLMEGSYEQSTVGTTNVDETMGGEGPNLSDNEAAASPLIPEKSKERYENTFISFEQWCREKDFNDINENVLTTYFTEKSLVYKSSSLWAIYSMLRSTILVKKNIDISKYSNLMSFLKNRSAGYKAKKSEVFKKQDFERFLKEADDHTYLLMKVAMIIGVAGACRREEITHLLTCNVIDEGEFIRVQPPDSRNRISREFLITAGNIENVNLVEIVRKYINLRPASADHQRFFLTYRNGKCTKQPVGINSFGAMPRSIARYLRLPNPEQYTGHCFRRTSNSLKLVPQVIQLTKFP